MLKIALRQLEKRHGKVSAQARALGVTEDAIYKWRRGYGRMRTVTILLAAFAQAAADTVGLTVEELVERIELHLERHGPSEDDKMKESS